MVLGVAFALSLLIPSLSLDGLSREREGKGWRNVFANAGHGTMGWTLSLGSAEVMAALVVRKAEEAPVDPGPFALLRFGWREVVRRQGGRVGGRKEEEGERESVA